MFDYFYGNEHEQYTHIQIPLALIKDTIFKPLSGDSKLLYGLLLNRTSLSIRNNWHDDQNRVYIIYTIDEIMSDLNCATQKACKLTKELEKIGLIENVRRGLNKPNLIYVKNFASVSKHQPKNSADKRNFENQNSGISEIKIQELRKSKSSNTYINNNNFSDIKSKSSQSQTKKKTDMTLTIDNDTSSQNKYPEKEKRLLQPATTPQQSVNGLKSQTANTQYPTDDYTTHKTLIQHNIEYNHFLYNYQPEIELVDELVNCMLDVICTKGDTVKINGEEKNRNMVISQYLKIDALDIEHILEKYKNINHKITHLHNYLKTMLYTIKQECGHYYANQVRVDVAVR